METLTKTFRTANKDRVIVTVTIGETDRPHIGTDHSIVRAGAATVSFVADLIPYRHRQPVACGQLIDDVPDSRVRDLWRRWHLNGMRSHCAHQNAYIQWDKVAPCEVTGYQAGTAWLFEPVPADVLDMIRDAL